MWWDADIDAVMRATRTRPIPSGRVEPGEALALGLGLSGFSVMLLGLAANWTAAALLAFTIFFYAVVYTMWLKRRTPQNIVIGGLAGALPPLVGWVAATGSFAWAPVLMVLLVFMWTPPHFWALALFVRTDYGLARVPMLTETHGDRATRAHILAYALLLVPVSLVLSLSVVAGPVYLAASFVLNLLFVQGAFAVWRRTRDAAEADRWGVEKRLFKLSLLYLFLHFGAFWQRRRWEPKGGLTWRSASSTRSTSVAGDATTECCCSFWGDRHRLRLTVVKALNLGDIRQLESFDHVSRPAIVTDWEQEAVPATAPVAEVGGTE
jgi:protoheme IX farnesyltransferase